MLWVVVFDNGLQQNYTPEVCDLVKSFVKNGKKPLFIKRDTSDVNWKGLAFFVINLNGICCMQFQYTPLRGFLRHIFTAKSFISCPCLLCLLWSFDKYLSIRLQEQREFARAGVQQRSKSLCKINSLHLSYTARGVKIEIYLAVHTSQCPSICQVSPEG